jgi:hypothetical protein
MGALIGFFTSRIGKLIGALVLAASILVGVFQSGRKAQRDDDRVEDLEDYIETKKEIDDVATSPDRDAAVDRMRRNGWL